MSYRRTGWLLRLRKTWPELRPHAHISGPFGMELEVISYPIIYHEEQDPKTATIKVRYPNSPWSMFEVPCSELRGHPWPALRVEHGR